MDCLRGIAFLQEVNQDKLDIVPRQIAIRLTSSIDNEETSIGKRIDNLLARLNQGGVPADQQDGWSWIRH
jgi:hypothetical protein